MSAHRQTGVSQHVCLGYWMLVSRGILEREDAPSASDAERDERG